MPRTLRLAALALLCSASSLLPPVAGPALAQPGTMPTIEMVALPKPFGAAWLSRPDPAWNAAPLGAVIVLPDAMGADPRALPYVEVLLRHGFVVLEIGIDDPATDRQALSAAVVVARTMIADRYALPPYQVGLLGFGQGAEVALGWAGFVPVAALYPRCAAVSAPTVAAAGELPALLFVLHPATDPTDAPGACQRLVSAFGPDGYRHAYDDATPGWDILLVGSVSGPTLQPRDSASYAGWSAGLRYTAIPNAAVTQDAATRVALFLAAAVDGRDPPQDAVAAR